MKTILLRIAIVVFALGFTLVTFGFWGEFSRAMNNYLAVAYKDDDQKPQRPPQKKGVVNMIIVPATPLPANPACQNDPKHPCPKP
jgi:hypothetical protein